MGKGGKMPLMTSTADVTKTASALVIAAGNKAGMEGIDRARIDEIILRESGNSAYMKQQRKRDETVNRRISEMKSRLEKRGNNGWDKVQDALVPKMEKYLSERSTRSTCCVVDMDMFYMACELLSRPHLRDKPACVGNTMITTSNYVARRYGVRAAMAGWIGDKLVEELSEGKERLIHVPNNFALYRKKSQEVKEVLSEYDPGMRSYSLDEVYLDLGMYVAQRLEGLDHEDIRAVLKKSCDKELSDDDTAESNERKISVSTLQPKQKDTADPPLAQVPPEMVLRVTSQVVVEMRQKVFKKTGLTCSAGLAPNFLLAKIASDINKPNGQMVVGPAHPDIIKFLHPLPVRKVGGIGRVTEKILNAFGVATVQDLYNHRAEVSFLFKPATAEFLLRAALGCSSSHSDDSVDETGQKGISRERTFKSGEPLQQVVQRLEDIARMLADDMKKKKIKAHTITVKVKLHTFDVMSRSMSMARGVYIHEACDLVRLSTEMFHELRKEFKGGYFSVRLLGIRCSNFQSELEKDDDVGGNQMKMETFLMRQPAKEGGDDSVSASLSNLPPTASKRKCKEVEVEKMKTEGDSKRKIDPQEWRRQPRVACPICGQATFDESDNESLNAHIDVCLNGSTIRQTVKQVDHDCQVVFAAAARKPQRARLDSFETKQTRGCHAKMAKTRKRTLTDFFCTDS